MLNTGGQQQQDRSVAPHLLCVGGDDHHLRIPFLLALRTRGFRVSAAGTGDPTPFATADLDYYPLHFGRFFSPIADWRGLRTVSKLIADLRPSIVQCFDTKPYLLVPLAARRRRDVRVVSTINGIGVLYTLHSPLARALRLVYESLQRLAARSTDVTVFQNHHDQAFFASRRMLGASTHLVIPGSGIDIDRFDRALASSPSRSEVREALGLGASEVVITVTRMTRQKGIPALLEAATLVHRQRPDVRFLLVGPRETEGRFAVTQAEIDQNAPYVLAIGRRSDVPALLKAADVFAFPTEYPEGVPRALLEAGAAGLPIVTTNVQGCTDVIRDRWSGLVVPQQAPGLLADRIIDLLRDRDAAKVMGACASQWVRHQFNLDVTVDRYTTVYDNLLKPQKGAQGDGPLSRAAAINAPAQRSA